MVPAGGVNGDTSWLVDDEELIVLVDDANRQAGDRGFVAVEGVGEDMAVLDDCCPGSRLAVYSDMT